MLFSIVSVFVLLVVPAQVLGRSLLVNTTQGPVRGYEHQDGGIFIFYGIPYATVPTGNDKFKAPLPPPKWSEPFDAVDKGVICPQIVDKVGLVPGDKNMQEDCLIATVYVPDTNRSHLSVVVYVHGGGYVIGYGDSMTPKHLVKSKKVIAVTFNYRVGVHGFLCLGTEFAPGNAGMKDQLALLRWVKANIESFGGNSNDVTIAGFSAGASSVDLLMLSKAAVGLFNKVIPESGANTAAFSVQVDPLRNAKMFANMLNFTNIHNMGDLENFYKTATLELLLSFGDLDLYDSTFLFAPCVERNLGQEVFLEDNPYNILKRSEYIKLPMLYGFTEMDGLLRIDNFDDWKYKMNKKFSDFLPADLHFENVTQRENVARIVKKFYFGPNIVNEETILDYVNYFTDITFQYPALRSVELQIAAGNDKIYLYEYSYVDDSSPLVPHTNVRGAPHCAQTNAVLDSIDENIILENLKKHKKLIREIWLNFITTGNPVPENSSLPKWPAVGERWSPYMSLGRKMELRDSLLSARTQFWEQIYEKYYNKPIPPLSIPKNKQKNQ